MPVQHIVLFKVKPDAPADALEAMKSGILGLKETLPGLVTSVTFGKSFTDRHNGYTHSLCMVLPSREALAEYSPHPLHQEVVQKRILPFVDGVMAVDYDI